MEKLVVFRKFILTLCAGLTALVVSAAPAFAQHVGGSSRGGVGHVGAYGGYRGGYGYRGYGGWGWRGGYWGWGPWGWGGLGLGLYFATLPYYYSTYWWGGVPYYYADNNYFLWDAAAGQYVTVAPPAGLANQPNGQDSGAAGPGPAIPGQPSTSELMVYPKNGQTQEQLGKDKYECHKWAASQTGFDPTQAGGTAPNRRSDYLRAQAACLEGRGYSVK